jgi:Fur family peroxide stress response transcriptional regulator
MISKLRQKGAVQGFKRTPQRLAILEYLDGNTAHPSAETIYHAVSKKYRSMSFATVYNTLNKLVAAGALRDLTIDPERRRYDPNTELHHHLLCLGCRKVVDIPEQITVAAPPGLEDAFTVVGHHIEFYGYCAPCGRKKRSK